jgi:hypothetical protein
LREPAGIDCPADPEVGQAIASWAVEHCPVTDAVGRAVRVSVEIDAAG